MGGRIVAEVAEGLCILVGVARGDSPELAGRLAGKVARLRVFPDALYERFCSELEALGVPVGRGVFGAKMEVELVNDGPVTVIIDA